jgi:hypothetical protein
VIDLRHRPVTSRRPAGLLGAGHPRWDEPAFDDSSWPEASRAGFARVLRARRSFTVERPRDLVEAVLRVRGVSDFVVRLNGVEVGRGGGPGEPDATLSVPLARLRPGVNALALEGLVEGNEGVPPSLELSLVSHPSSR